MTNHIANRELITRSLVEELVGPAPAGPELDCSQPLRFESVEDAYGPWKQKGTGEEILMRDPPTKRYGVGVLYPSAARDEEENLEEAGLDSIGFIAGEPEHAEEEDADASAVEALQKDLEEALEKLQGARDDSPQDLDLPLFSAYKPSSIGVSFFAEFPEGARLLVEASGGRYRQIPVRVADREFRWWLRYPVQLRAEFAGEAICSGSGGIAPETTSSSGLGEMDIRIEVYSRQFGDNRRCRLVTVVLVNRSDGSVSLDESCLFQAAFRASVVSNGGNHILPYPGPPFENLDDEEKSLELLYRKAVTFAVGHGCAAGWENATEDRANAVKAECLPFHEVPSVTPEISDSHGNRIEIPMVPLAGLIPDEDGFSMLEDLVRRYEEWVLRKEEEARGLSEEYQEPAKRHLDQCMRCARRMKRGIKYLRENPLAKRAFQLANKAILLQQLYSRRNPRRAIYDANDQRIRFDEEFLRPDPITPGPGKGKWYAFQIAFLLMVIESTAEKDCPDRETIELIWFPTGGGKTEAYLGLAAFAQFMRRLRDPDDDGVHVLMRYTLRLLTTQQFQRAARLVCAMEYIRRNLEEELGGKPFSIGLWVGRENSPNTRQEAIRILRALRKGERHVRNTFVIDRCPWCGAQMGVIEHRRGDAAHAPRILGYAQESGTVVFQCPDASCDFSNRLPIHVIDEDIYDERPSMIIGTVDKFAMLAWRPEARHLFGIGGDGHRYRSPPGLIIQDELHMISGPLGSMVGLYEAVIEELCTDRREQGAGRPKIISSTATIRRYLEQVRALYGRDDVVLFPPPGLEAGDSFFARYATDSSGNQLPGTLYVGVHAPGLGSMQTIQVRTFTALLQAPMLLPDEERDPWWTLLLFFNSLRELGTTLSLLQSDILDYQKVLLFRTDRERRQRRAFPNILELTGRVSSEEIPKAIAKLEVGHPNETVRPVDVCLASSILEVGVDIDRLSLMSVVGQPKTTSQYIQVTGRIGRRWRERPGLVVTIYSASKPRDRSHYEKFRSYHTRLYSNVEPTSVTPFSPPTLDRALHAVMVSYVRQAGDKNVAQSPYPFPEQLIDQLEKIMLPRLAIVDPSEIPNFRRVFAKRAKQWKEWQRTKWRGGWGEDDVPLLRAAGDYASPEQTLISWATPQSMRTVDAECIAEIALPLLVEDDLEDAK